MSRLGNSGTNSTDISHPGIQAIVDQSTELSGLLVSLLSILEALICTSVFYELMHKHPINHKLSNILTWSITIITRHLQSKVRDHQSISITRVSPLVDYQFYQSDGWQMQENLRQHKLWTTWTRYFFLARPSTCALLPLYFPNTTNLSMSDCWECCKVVLRIKDQGWEKEWDLERVRYVSKILNRYVVCSKSDICFKDTEQLARMQSNATGNDKRISWHLWLDVTQSHFNSEICFEEGSYVTKDV